MFLSLNEDVQEKWQDFKMFVYILPGYTRRQKRDIIQVLTLTQSPSRSMGFQNNVFLIILCIMTCDGRSYTNYSLFMGIPTNRQELEFYKNMEIEYDVKFWKEPVALFKAVEFIIDPEQLDVFMADVKENDISITHIMRDVQSAFDKQVVRPYFRTKLETFGWRSFYRLGAIYEWLEDLQHTYPKILKIEKIGWSSEKRPIYAVKLKHSTNETLPKVVIEGGIHAREWISPAFVTYLINELVKASQSENKDLKRIALAFEWLVIPVLNPDGYEYSHTTDRLWRKNRRGGYGVDINRNFGIEFGTVGVERKTNSESFCGETEFSESESRAVVQFLEANKRNLLYYVAFHSFGQYFIIPYTFTAAHLENYEQVEEMARRAMNRLRQRDGTEYAIGTAAATVGYMVSGASTCWAKRQFSIPFVACIELRDTGIYGFALPPEQILPTCLETMDALYSFLDPSATTESLSNGKFVKSAVKDNNRACSMLPDFIIVFICFYLTS